MQRFMQTVHLAIRMTHNIYNRVIWPRIVLTPFLEFRPWWCTVWM